MESGQDAIRAALRQADRAEAAPWTDYPPTPRWYPPATGLWAAGLTLTLGVLDGGARAGAVIGLIAAECAFLGWYVRYRGGVMPTGRAPRELRPAIARFVTAIVLIALGAVALGLAVGGWAAAALVLVGITTVVTWYERAYAEAVGRVRERLA